MVNVSDVIDQDLWTFVASLQELEMFHPIESEADSQTDSSHHK